MSSSDSKIPSTPEAAAAQAQSREGAMPLPEPTAPPQRVPAGLYTLGEGVTRAERMAPYERKGSDPVYRPLRIFTLDPATSPMEGSIAVINLPYETLRPGPEGHLFKVEDTEAQPDLQAPAVLIQNGITPSMSSPGFRGQMTYAVCTSVYAAFRAALGRYVAWGFDGPVDPLRPLKLIIRPVGFEGQNAFYQKRDGTLQFGWYLGDKTKTIGNNLPGGKFYTCLSHDIIAHEVTHALLDGLRANFTFPSGLDVLAFHEGFADLVAIFQRFSYERVVHAAIRHSGADIAKSELLTSIAEQFGQTTEGRTSLRSAIDISPSSDSSDQKPSVSYGQPTEAHQLGSVLVSAVFEAFTTVFNRKTQSYLRLASGGTGILRHGDLPLDLVDILARTASRLASQFLSILIRSIDYCPPVDLRFGDFLRAMITADHDLVPDDPFGYREAIVDAFRRRGIFPLSVENLSEDALIWNPPREESGPIGPITELDFANLRFRGDPQNAAGAKELTRQARALGDIICQPRFAEEFGLISMEEATRKKVDVALPCIQSIRSSRRVGPDGQIIFDLVAEVTQKRTIVHENRSFDFYGGATVILGPHGDLRYVVSKSVLSQTRLQAQLDFMRSKAGQSFWDETKMTFKPQSEMFRLLHGPSVVD